MFFKSRPSKEVPCPPVLDYGKHSKTKPAQYRIGAPRELSDFGSAGQPRVGDGSKYHFRTRGSAEDLLSSAPPFSTRQDRKKKLPPGSYNDKYPDKFRNTEKYFCDDNGQQYAEYVGQQWPYSQPAGRKPGATRIIADQYQNVKGMTYHPSLTDRSHVRAWEGLPPKGYPPHHQQRLHPAQLKWYQYGRTGGAPQPVPQQQLWPPAAPGAPPKHHGNPDHFAPKPLTRAPPVSVMPKYRVRA